MNDRYLVRPKVAALLVLAMLAGLLALSQPTAAQTATKPPLKVVQLGDSYSAGNGARNAAGDRNYVGVEGCYRSPTNWGGQFVESLKVDFNVTYVNRACSGGVISEITGERSFKNAAVAQLQDCPDAKYPDEEYWVRTDGLPFDRCQRRLFPQINAVDESADLVLMTGGGNDAEFAKVVEQCFAVGFRDPGDCREAVDFASGELENIENRLVNTFRELRERMRDDAKIVFVSYPYLVDDVGYELVFRLLGIERDRYNAGAQIRALGEAGDARQRAAVDRIHAELGEEFVIYVDDIKDLFNGRAPNPFQDQPRNPNRWLYEFETRIPAEWYHYKPEGHEAIANLLSGRKAEFMLNPVVTPGEGSDLDVVFVVDTTGSMAGEIGQVRANLSALVDQLAATTDSFRVGVVSYRDFPERTGNPSDYPARVDREFTDSLPLIQAAIDSLGASGGGDFPETVFSGLDAAFDLSWRAGVTKVAIVIGDAPAFSPEPISGLTASGLIAKSLAIDPVQVVGVDVGSLTEPGLEEIAAGTGGSIQIGTSDLIGTISDILDDAATQPFAWPGGPYSGKPGIEIQFDASGSFDPSGDAIVLYEWDFDGDGVYDATTTDPTIEYAYPEDYEGVMVLRVTGTDATALGSTIVDINADGSAPQGDDEPCEVDEDGVPIIVEDGIPALCVADNLPTEDLEGVFTEVEGGEGSEFGELSIELDGVAWPGEPLDLTAEFTGGVEPYSVEVDWGDGLSCPGSGACLVDPMEDMMPGIVDAEYEYASSGVYTVTVTVTDSTGASISASATTAECTIIGTDRNDTLRGTDGDDVICGLGGNDRIFGGDGDDTIIGGSGRDNIRGDDGADVILGGRDSDTVTGGAGDDVISGGPANDLLKGADGDDLIKGRLGDDRIFGENGNDELIGDRGGDRLYGGNDDDVLRGRRDADRLLGNNGDDDLFGGQGRDNLAGGNGSDDLFGGTGADALNGGRNDDALDGGDGVDQCRSGGGVDSFAACER